MAKKILSIEAGRWWTKVVLTEPYKRSAVIDDLFYFRTPSRAVEDGYVRDRDRFVRALKEELAKRQIAERDVIFTLGSTKIITRDIIIPMVKDKQLPGVVDAQAKETFPMDITTYSIAYKKMGEVMVNNVKSLRLLLIAVPDNLMSNYMSVASAAGLNLDSFEYIGNSSVNFALSHYSTDGVVVQLEENVTIVSIISGKRLMFQRVAPNGYGATLDAIMEHSVLGISDDQQAYDFLTQHNVLFKRPRLSEISSEDDEKRQAELEEAYDDIKDALNYHVRVAITALEYYSSQSGRNLYGVMRVVGDGARIKGLDKLFADSLTMELRTEPATTMVRLTKRAAMEDVAGVDFTSALGAVIAPLAVRPKEMVAKATKQTTLKTAYAALTISVLLSGGLVFAGFFRYNQAATEHIQLTKRIDELSYIHAIYDENAAVKAEANQYRAFDGMTVTENEKLSQLIAGLEQHLPSNVTVTSLAIQDQDITLNMTSPDELTVTQLLLNLYDIPIIEYAYVPGMTKVENEFGDLHWEYSVVVSYVPEEVFVIEPEPVETTATEEGGDV